MAQTDQPHDRTEHLLRLMYLSAATASNDEASIESILQASSVHNPLSGITGLLCSSRSHFLQVIEGFPIGMLLLVQLISMSERARKNLYAVAALLTLAGIFAMRWNVVIGGQLFSKSFLGYTTYQMGFATREGLLPALLLMILPLVILAVLVKILPPMPEAEASAEETA